MDRRVRYTRMVLNESLLKFLELKPLTKITVKELCQDADVNRSTYYAHFNDPFDQFNTLKNELLNEIAEYTKKLDTAQLPPWERQYRVLKNILQYIEKKRRIFQIILNISGDHALQEQMLNVIGEKVFPELSDYKTSETEQKYLFIYAINGCFGMFYHWLMSEQPIDPDKLAHLMADFTGNAPH